MTLQPSEQAGIVATIDPDVLTAATHESDWVDMADWHELLAIILVGELGTDATVDAKLEQAQDSSGTGAKDIDGKAITQLDEGDGDDDKQVLINLKSNELDVENGFTHVRLSITVATASSDGAGAIIGLHPRYGPASDHDLDSVDEIVT